MTFELVKISPAPRVLSGTVLLCSVFLAACDGGTAAHDLQSRVEVAASNYTSLQMAAPNRIIEVAQSQQLTLNALSNSDVLGTSVAGSAVWSVNNPDIATVDQSGMMTGIADGTVNVQARYGPLFSATSVRVSAASLVSIQVSAAVESINECGSVQLTANGAYDDGLELRNLTDDVTWAVVDSTTSVGAFDSSDPSGFFRTTGAGTLSVIASRNGIEVDPPFSLEVLNNLDTVTIPEPTDTLTTSSDLQLSAVANYNDEDLTTADITDNATWSVDDSTVATVDSTLPSKGLVDASQTGSVTVFAACGNAPVGMVSLLSGDPDVVETVFFGRTSPHVFSYVEVTTLQLKAYVRLETQQVVDITEDSDWTLVQVGNNLNTLSNASDSKGELIIRGVGNIRVQVEYTGDDYEDSTLNIPELELRPQ